MNIPAIAAALPAQLTTAPISSSKPSKPQRRMARPPLDGTSAPAPAASALPANKPPLTPAPGTKIAAVIALLGRKSGATLAELIAATSWLPHTTRAALTGLRKKGHAIERTKRGEETCYRIVVGAAGQASAADAANPAA